MVQYGVLCTGRIQFSQQRRAWRNANGGTGFGGKSLPQYARHTDSPLIPTKGAEIGVRTSAVPHLQSTLSLWYLHSASELQQSGDTGGTTASTQPSNRYGVEWANYYTPLEHLAFDFDLADSRALFTEIDGDDAAPDSPGGKRVPEAVGLVISSGITLHDYKGFSASLRLRNFRPARFDLRRNLSIKSNGFAQCGGRLSNSREMARFGRIPEFA